MTKEITDGIRAAINNENITYMDLKVEDTSPRLTAGWTDEDIKGMDSAALEKLLEQIDNEEAQLRLMEQNIRERRNNTLAVMRRKAEIG